MKAQYAAKKEALNEYDKARYETNRVTANERRREKIACSKCGKVVNRSSMRTHKTRKTCMEHSNSDLSD